VCSRAGDRAVDAWRLCCLPPAATTPINDRRVPQQAAAHCSCRLPGSPTCLPPQQQSCRCLCHVSQLWLIACVFLCVCTCSSCTKHQRTVPVRVRACAPLWGEGGPCLASLLMFAPCVRGALNTVFACSCCCVAVLLRLPGFAVCNMCTRCRVGAQRAVFAGLWWTRVCVVRDAGSTWNPTVAFVGVCCEPLCCLVPVLAVVRIACLLCLAPPGRDLLFCVPLLLSALRVSSWCVHTWLPATVCMAGHATAWLCASLDHRHHPEHAALHFVAIQQTHTHTHTHTSCCDPGPLPM
jgi:hypothetical protein